MKRMALLLGLGLGLGFGAGCHKAAPATTPNPVTTTAPVAAPFTLVALKFYLGDDLGLQLHPDGRVEENTAKPGSPPEWKLVGKLSAEGKIYTADGTEVGAVQPDGSFKSSKGEVKFDGDVMVVEDKRFTFDDKGVLQGAPDMGKPLRVEGLTDEGSRRIALFIVMLTADGYEPPPPPSGANPDAPPSP